MPPMNLRSSHRLLEHTCCRSSHQGKCELTRGFDDDVACHAVSRAVTSESFYCNRRGKLRTSGQRHDRIAYQIRPRARKGGGGTDQTLGSHHPILRRQWIQEKSQTISGSRVMVQCKSREGAEETSVRTVRLRQGLQTRSQNKGELHSRPECVLDDEAKSGPRNTLMQTWSPGWR